jgi:nitroreductase
MMLEAAMMAPSAKNARPWSFLVVENRETINKMMDAHPYAKMLATASLAIVVCGIPSGEEDELFPLDCGAATENLLLQAVDLGLGACWCALYPRMARVAEYQKILGTGDIPYALVAVGIPDESPAPRGKYDDSKVKFI